MLDLSVATALRTESQEKQKPVEELLLERNIPEKDITVAKGEATGFPVKYLQGESVPVEAMREIPEESARHYSMVPLGRNEGFLDVGMLYPEDMAAKEALKFIATKTNLPVRIFIITPSDFQKIIQEYKSLSGEVNKALTEFEKEYQNLDEEVKVKKTKSFEIVEDAPVTKMVSVVLKHAVEGHASDIHIEPLRDKLRVRFRVDGELATNLSLPLDVHAAIVSRIKIMTNLKIDETRIPQDGRFRSEVSGRDIDFRVSTFPTAIGEKVVIRILDTQTGVKKLEDLGFAGRNLELLKKNMSRPYGMILITGPTGSGKSTTLYAMLQILNQEKTNIVSLEDPVEYYMEGVNQSQIRPEIGYDFANGLRSILRQDPDIIMVGEIRDKETAALAIHAALTGHLVLSTLHTNTATGVIPRLIDMGVDPYLIAPSLIMAVGQRLVRKLCPDSRKEIEVSGRVKDILTEEISKMPTQIQNEIKNNIPTKIYQASVSPICPKGTKGRSGIFEVLSMTPELEKIILTAPSENKIMEEANRQNMTTMKQDGIKKVIEGVIGLEELMKAT